MNKTVIFFLLGLSLVLAAGWTPTQHSDFLQPHGPVIVGYYNDWGHMPFDPIEANGGLMRTKDANIVIFAFYTLTKELDIVWGGTGYDDGNLIDGTMRCAVFSSQNKEFENSFCTGWQASGFCPSTDLQCMLTIDKPLWCGAERLAPIAKKCQELGQTFGISIGGWSDTLDTPTDETTAVTLGNNIVDFINGLNAGCSEPFIKAVDFDWEHLSNNTALGTRADRIAAYVKVLITIRQSLPDIIMSYTTRFNAYSSYEQDGKEFDTNLEGFSVAAAFQQQGEVLQNVMSFVNIMSYDIPPNVISSNGWSPQAYQNILTTFDARHGGLFQPGQIVMGIEPGQQAAGGIYPGYNRTLCMADYVKDQQYGGISLWSLNQFTYRYKNATYQQECNFTGTTYNQTAWNLGWPSGVSQINPNCMKGPYNGQINVYSGYCVENISPFMAWSLDQLWNQDAITVTQQMCDSPSYIPCGAPIVPPNTTNTTNCSAYQQEILELQQEIKILKGELSECEAEESKIEKELQQCEGELAECNAEVKKLEDELKNCNKTIIPPAHNGSVIPCWDAGCQAWKVSESGLNHNIPESWCYTDCYAPGAHPLGLNIACQQVTDPMFRFCECTYEPFVNISQCQQLNQQAQQNPQFFLQTATPVDLDCAVEKKLIAELQQEIKNLTQQLTSCNATLAQEEKQLAICEQEYQQCEDLVKKLEDELKHCHNKTLPVWNCSCQGWALTQYGQEHGVPVSWCYKDCYAPGAYPDGLHIACDWRTDEMYRYCTCNNMPDQPTSQCYQPAPTSFFQRPFWKKILSKFN